MRKLHIGGWAAHPEWEIFDAVPGPAVDHAGDARDLSRFADGTFDALYASHVLEHFDYAGELERVLREWRRVLAPGGTLYVSVPDLDVLCGLFVQKDRLPAQDRFQIMRMIFGGHTTPFDHHQVGFNTEFLAYFLERAGFVELRRTSDFGLFADTSRLAVAGVPISLNVIARKPGEKPQGGEAGADMPVEG